MYRHAYNFYKIYFFLGERNLISLIANKYVPSFIWRIMELFLEFASILVIQTIQVKVNPGGFSRIMNIYFDTHFNT